MVKIAWPVASTWPITTRFNERLHIELPDGTVIDEYHPGIDIGVPEGEDVYASHAGTCYIEWTEAGGNCARVDGDGIKTRYCHLQSIIGGNREVRAGEVIGKTGKTGKWLTAPHLHWECRINRVLVDPLLWMGKGEGDMSKIALHFQGMPSWAGSVVERHWQFPKWVKAINPPVPDIFPGTFVLGRAWTRGDMNQWEANCIARGVAGGAEYFNALLPLYNERYGIVTAWEAANEPDLSDTTKAAKYRDYLDEWSRLMHGVGLKCCGGSISVGNPKLIAFNGSNEELKIIAPSLKRCDYWSYHGYWQRPYDPADNWWAHRYRLIVSECAAMGITLPPCIISETGADIGGGYNDGWRSQYSGDWNAYFTDIKRYSLELNKDTYVQAAMFFTSGPEAGWANFEIDQGQADLIGQYVQGDIPQPVPPRDGLPTDETTTSPAIMAEKIRWWSEESQRCFEAGNTTRATAIRLSNIHLCYRLENILKAT